MILMEDRLERAVELGTVARPVLNRAFSHLMMEAAREIRALRKKVEGAGKEASQSVPERPLFFGRDIPEGPAVVKMGGGVLFVTKSGDRFWTTLPFDVSVADNLSCGQYFEVIDPEAKRALWRTHDLNVADIYLEMLYKGEV